MATAGELNARITVMRRATGEDAAGQPATGWVEHVRLWANILHPSGVQQLQAGAQTSVVRASIKVRRRADITAAMRVHHRAAVYDIEAVLPDEVARTHMFLVCKAST